jgi:xylulose-5-phosphate/fructose-6-phosphate phosphoketolase
MIDSGVRYRLAGPDQLEKMQAYWRAANYLSVGQIYLKDNPLLELALSREHIKPRLLGHWGTTPGLNFIYVHLNRLIREHQLDMMLITGPGHGGPGIVANTYLEGSYTERYPAIERSRNGMQRLFRQFSWPGGIPSHAAPETPGSIHEGGELGYSLLHAFGAAFDNPDLIVACVVGDGEAETGALAASWHSNKFLNPARDGAVLPILHLNGFKIANPTLLARIDATTSCAICCAATATSRCSSKATSRRRCISSWPRRWTRARRDPRIQQQARADGTCDARAGR